MTVLGRLNIEEISDPNRSCDKAFVVFASYWAIADAPRAENAQP